ncbi:MAG: hypothetical protein ACYS9X_02110 [Planctomycetota bacterium]|jgi:hypothetical protein
MGDPPADPDAPDVFPHDDDAPERPRFPYAVAAFALACVVCATWLWMSYSYAWETTTKEVQEALENWETDWARRHRAYVRIVSSPLPVAYEFASWDNERVAIQVEYDPSVVIVVETPFDCSDVGELRLPDGPWEGRLMMSVIDGPRIAAMVDTTASRFTPETVAGLVVAAMGMGVFALYLKKWLAERRQFNL